MLQLGVRALPAARCDGARRGPAAAAIPSAALSYTWEGLVAASPPLHLGIFACRAGEGTSRAAGASLGSFSASEGPQGAGSWGCSPSAGSKVGGSLPDCMQGVWLQPSVGTRSAEPPGHSPEQVQQPLLCHQLFCTTGSLGSGDSHPESTWASRAGERRRNTLEIQVRLWRPGPLQTPLCHQHFRNPWLRAALLSWWGQVGSAAHLHETEYQHDKSGLLAQLPKKGSLQPVCC